MTFRFYYQTADNGGKLFLVTLFSSGSMSKAETKSIKRNLGRILESDALIKYLVTWRYALFPQVHTSDCSRSENAFHSSPLRRPKNALFIDTKKCRSSVVPASLINRCLHTRCHLETLFANNRAIRRDWRKETRDDQVQYEFSTRILGRKRHKAIKMTFLYQCFPYLQSGLHKCIPDSTKAL